MRCAGDQQRDMPKTIVSIPGVAYKESSRFFEMRRYAQRTRRFMACYRKGLDGIQAEFAMKQYKSHRSVVETVYRDVDRQTI